MLTSIDAQSPDIAMGVNESLEVKEGAGDADDQIGAGDQGMMFGYACDETPELMPLPISLAHKLSKQLAKVRKEGSLTYLRPDGKSQVTVEYDGDDRPVRVEAVVVSTQHDSGVNLERIREDIQREVIRPIIPEELMDQDTKIYISCCNSSSNFLAVLWIITALICICTKVHNFISFSFQVLYYLILHVYCSMIITNSDFHDVIASSFHCRLFFDVFLYYNR